MAPTTGQCATLKENRGANTGSILAAIAPDVEDKGLWFSLPGHMSLSQAADGLGPRANFLRTFILWDSLLTTGNSLGSAVNEISVCEFLSNSMAPPSHSAN